MWNACTIAIPNTLEWELLELNNHYYNKIYYNITRIIINDIIIIIIIINNYYTCDALFCVSHILQNTLGSGKQAKIVQIDFSAAIDGVNHQGILYKHCSVGIGVFFL